MFIFYSFIKNFSNATFHTYFHTYLLAEKQYNMYGFHLARAGTHLPFTVIECVSNVIPYVHIDDPHHAEYFCIMIAIVFVVVTSIVSSATRSIRIPKICHFSRTNKIVLCICIMYIALNE